MTGVEQQHGRPDQLAFRQPIAPGLDDGGQLAEQVVAWARPSIPDEVPQVRLERGARLGRPALHLGGGVQLEHQGHVGRPRAQQVAIRLGDPEELGDDGDGDELHRVGDQVELAGVPGVRPRATIDAIRGRSPRRFAA